MCADSGLRSKTFVALREYLKQIEVRFVSVGIDLLYLHLCTFFAVHFTRKVIKKRSTSEIYSISKTGTLAVWTFTVTC